MRIVSGSRGGRRLKTPSGRAIRPTPDRVREALFSILAPSLPGARFLDLFAGTGANGLEALSRGARSAVFVDSSRLAVSLIRENIEQLEFSDRAVVVSGTLPAALSRLDPHDPFDLVFADPPYQSNLLAQVLSSPRLAALLAPNALVIVEVGRKSQDDWENWRVDSVRDYGDTRLFFLGSSTRE